MQGSLFEAVEARDSLFFAILPDATAQTALLERAQALRRALRLNGQPRPAALLHASLHRVVDEAAGLPPDRVRAALQAGQATAWPVAFELRLDTAVHFGAGRRRPIVLTGKDNPGFAELHRLLGAALRGVGVRTAAAAQAHVSLIYDPHPVLPQPVEPVAWTVREVALIHSRFRRGHYDVVASWRLD